ncbi:MAG TPA: hypothetical protein VJ776_01090 [Thermoanaerobaculia bacterium]|nr:hypothetical protein [Thermoanaerobaculia bacterium]
MRIGAARILFLAGIAGTMAAAPARKPTPSPSPAASVSPAAAPSPAAVMSPSCTAPQYRQFDFWLGEWDLVGADGKKSAEDKVVQILGGCAIQENWTSVKSGQGLSLSAYDPATRHWHQTLMDDSGAVLKLEGEFAEGKMVLIGQRPSQKEKGVTITHRIAWTPQPDHRVKENWELSTNGGRTWRPVFEGTYVPRREMK